MKKFSLKIIIKFKKKKTDLSHQSINTHTLFSHCKHFTNCSRQKIEEKKNSFIQFTFANVTNDVGTKSVLIIGISIIVRDYSYYNCNLLFYCVSIFNFCSLFLKHRNHTRCILYFIFFYSEQIFFFSNGQRMQM